MRIHSSFQMLGLKDETRRRAEEILSILAQDNGVKDSYFDEFPGVDASEVFPGNIFIGNK